MTQESIEPESSFKDYYEILHLHVEADAAMVDQAYWHLARLYNAAIPDEPDARRRLDDLNEAYSVLRDAGFRASYDKVRGELLRTGRLPDPDESEEDVPPLAVMAKQKPKARKKAKKEPKEKKALRLPSLPWQSVAAVLAFAGLAGGALAVGLPLAFVGGLLIAGLGLGLVLLVVRKLPGLPSLPSTDIKLPGLRAPRLPERSSDRDGVNPDSLHESTLAMRERWRSETHDATSGLPENTIWPKDIPPPSMSKVILDGDAEPSEPETKKPVSLSELSHAEGPDSVAEAPKPRKSAAKPAAQVDETFKDAVGELRRRGRAGAQQEKSKPDPQPSEEAEPQAQPASVLRDKDDASAEKPGPFSAVSGWPEPASEPDVATASEPAPASESFKDAVGELRRRGRADAPQETPAIAPQPSIESEPQAQPASILRDKDDAGANKPGPFSAASGSPEPANEAEPPVVADAPQKRVQAQPALVLHEQDDVSGGKPGSSATAGDADPPASDDDAPDAPPIDEKLADSLGALRRRWRAGAPKDLSAAFPQNTVWAKLESPEADPPDDDDEADDNSASDPE